MRKGMLLAVVAVVLAGCDVPFLSSPAPSPTPTDLKPADAAKLVNDFWAKRESAYTGLNGSPLDDVESADLNTIDRGIIDLRVKAKLPALAAARPISNVKVFAPHQTDYPATFLAMLDAQELDATFKPAGDSLTHLYIFVKPDPDTPYKAVLESIKDPAQPLPDLKVDKDGFATLVPAEGQAADYKAGSSQLGNLYGETLNAMIQGQNPPTQVFAAGKTTTQAADEIKKVRAAEAVLGVDLKIDFSGQTTTANYAFQTKDGEGLDFFLTNASVSFNGQAGLGCIIFLGGGVITEGVAPGRYQALGYTDVLMGTAVVPKASEKAKLITLPALNSGPSNISANPC